MARRLQSRVHVELWTVAMLVVLAVATLGALASMRTSTLDRVAVVPVVAAAATAFLLVGSIAASQPFVVALVLALALLSFVGQLACLHFADRWL